MSICLSIFIRETHYKSKSAPGQITWSWADKIRLQVAVRNNYDAQTTMLPTYNWAHDVMQIGNLSLAYSTLWITTDVLGSFQKPVPWPVPFAVLCYGSNGRSLVVVSPMDYFRNEAWPDLALTLTKKLFVAVTSKIRRNAKWPNSRRVDNVLTFYPLFRVRLL